MSKIADTEYAYASNLIRASGEKGTAAERLERIRDCRTAEELKQTAEDIFRMNSFDGSLSALLDRALENAAELLCEAVPDKGLYAPLFYKYDCCNIKICIKCSVRGISPDGLLFSCGTVSPENVIQAADLQITGVLPPNMERAVNDARSAFAAGDTAAIDFLLDSACYADMKASAEDGGTDFMVKYVRMKADMTNLLTDMRIGEMKLEPSAAASLMRRAFVPGGSVGIENFVDHDDALIPAENASFGVECSRMASAVQSASRSGDAERMLEEAYLAEIAGIKYIPFGFEVPAAYFIIREAEVKNCRLAAAALSARSDSGTAERIREAYV